MTNCTHTNTETHEINGRIYTNCTNCGVCVKVEDKK